eukprot:354874-Chlamydomonas_euryale.AAC.2
MQQTHPHPCSRHVHTHAADTSTPMPPTPQHPQSPHLRVFWLVLLCPEAQQLQAARRDGDMGARRNSNARPASAAVASLRVDQPDAGRSHRGVTGAFQDPRPRRRRPTRAQQQAGRTGRTAVGTAVAASAAAAAAVASVTAHAELACVVAAA